MDHTPESDEVKMISAKVLCERWGCTQTTLSSWRQNREVIPFLKIGNIIRYRMSDVLAVEQELLNDVAA